MAQPGSMTKHSARVRQRLYVSLAFAAISIAALLGGCGSGGGSSSSSTATKGSTAPNPAAATKPSCDSSTASAGAPEAQSAAQGDIPDNQQFLTYSNGSGGYSISYPEGWARGGSSSNVTFEDKSNTVTIKVVAGSRPTAASVTTQLRHVAAGDPCLKAGTPQAITLGPNQAVKVTYSTQGQKSPVTGQRPKITVDRYVYFANGKVATLDLATPVGVDNVDAYRMISESFRWS